MISTDILKDETIKAALMDSVVRSLGEDVKQGLIRDALSWLVKPSETGNYYSTKKDVSPLEDIIRNALRQVANEVAKETITNSPEFSLAVKTLLADAADAMLTKNRDKVINSIVEAMSRGFERDH